MKEINKKIGAVALAGTLIAGAGLSQGSISNAASGPDFVRKTLVNANFLRFHPQGSAYNFVEGYQYTSNYDAIYLGPTTRFNKYVKRTFLDGVNHRIIVKDARDSRIPEHFGLKNNHKYFYLSFKDGTEFVNKLDRLNAYRHRQDPVVVKIGYDYFAFFFKMTQNERNVLPMKQFIYDYGFTSEYAHVTNTPNGKAEMQSHIYNRFSNRQDVKGNREIINKILKEPNIKEGRNKNVFSDIEHFAYSLNNGLIDIPKGFSRYKVGNFDYIFKNNK